MSSSVVEKCEGVVLTSDKVAWLRSEVRAELSSLLDMGLNLSRTLGRSMSWDMETRLRIEVANDLAHVLDCVGWESGGLDPGEDQMRSLVFTPSAVRALEFLIESRADMGSDVPRKVMEMLAVRDTRWADVIGEAA